MHEKSLIPQSFEEICTPKLNKEVLSNKNIPVSVVKRVDKRSQNYQASVVKVTAGMVKLCDNLLKTEKQNYINEINIIKINTKYLLSLAMELIMSPNRATHTKHDATHITKTTANTGIKKHSK